ncbi:MAG: YihY/virulence factor BrkB family protein [Dehalococcoidales bacterium]|nr:YihY/virulence factor BrkB family protein [Dehalococcoidales bacterium]
MVILHRNLKTRSDKFTMCLRKTPAIQVIHRTLDGAGRHDATQRAAGVAYYAILSIFPLLLGTIALFGYFLPSVNVQDELLTFIGKNLPGARNILIENIAGIVKLRGPAGILSLVILFWSASTMFSALTLAINRAWEIDRYRPFFVRKAGELGMALSTGGLLILSLGASAFSAIIRSSINMQPAQLTILDLDSRLTAFLLILAVFLLLYKLAPYTQTRWRHIWPGALAGAIFFELARTLFIYYLEHFANYQLIYGSITSIIALLVWIYYSALIMILGAEFSFQFSCMRNAATVQNGV